MEKYRILPHTADGKFQAYGATLEEAFGNAALAMSSLMWDWSKVEPRVRHFVHVRGIDREQLLVKFLGETIYLFETKQFLLAKVDGLRIRPEFEASASRRYWGATRCPTATSSSATSRP